MKKILITLSFALIALFSSAQTGADYLQRYNLLVNRFGAAAVGVETLLQQWEKSDSADINVHIAKYNYYLARSSRDTVVTGYFKKYLGKTPVLTLKDSLGRNVNYFHTTLFDAGIFAEALVSLDKAISLNDKRLDVRFEKISALMQYEKDKPEMALRCLLSLIDENYSGKEKWIMPDSEIETGFFEESVQDYCYTFFYMSTEESYEAFRVVSEKMLKFNPKNVNYIDNMGTYYLVARKNNKKALSYYKKALKLNPEDEVASKNVSLINKK